MLPRLLAIALVACSAPVKSPEPPNNVGVPGTAKTAAVVVQLAYRGTFSIGPPFSTLPPFTLLDDGTLIAVEASSPVHTTTLSRDEVAQIIQHVRDLGFEKLESHTKSCKSNPDGTGMCVSDAAYTILRVALPTGKLHEVTTYADFSNEPAIHTKIVDYLEHHEHPHTALYQPSAAVMHVQPQDAPPIPRCPAIDPALLHVEPDTNIWAVRLVGPELEAILKLAPANNGNWIACAGKAMYRLVLVPGIPGFDLQGELDIYKPRKPE